MLRTKVLKNGGAFLDSCLKRDIYLQDKVSALYAIGFIITTEACRQSGVAGVLRFLRTPENKLKTLLAALLHCKEEEVSTALTRII